MIELKCPFCNGELVGTIGHPICRNQNCIMYDDTMPRDLLEELIRARKALDVAKNAINSAVDHNIINCIARGINPRTDDTNVTLCNALEKIIALEQKDVK